MRGGALAQLVEQWTENPCVPGSIPGGTTSKTHFFEWVFYFLKNTPPEFLRLFCTKESLNHFIIQYSLFD